jgi:hypothetical protein
MAIDQAVLREAGFCGEQMIFRDYDAERDKEATHRIWHEIDWIDKGEEEALDVYAGCGRAMVAEIDGEAECLVLSGVGTVRYLDEDLSFAGVTGVTTSRVARKQGFASGLTARVIAADAADGALVAGLGMFEQGFYNQLGFGTGTHDRWVKFDPARLRVKVKARVPRRITVDDWEMVHASRLARRRGHGSLILDAPGCTRAEMMWTKKGFGLGYCDGPDGELTHHLWGKADGEHGPYDVQWMTYQTKEQFLELMALLKNLGDQVHLVEMCEPPGIQLQDLIAQPFKQHTISEKSRFETGTEAWAWWQMRICDLPGCLARTHLRGETVRLNLKLKDPIERFLDADAPWRGVGGDYVVTLGRDSSAEAGADPALLTLSASVGAFTRLWLGVLGAGGLATTDELDGPQELLEALDWSLRLPKPRVDWDF